MHAVHLFRRSEKHAQEVARFLRPVLEAGGAAVVLAEPTLAAALRAEFPPERLYIRDAETVLDQFARHGLDEAAFRRIVASLHDRAAAAGDGTVAFYGELVALLWCDGRKQDAAELELMWNRLPHTFDLLCGYPLAACQGPSDAAILCDPHTHVSVEREAPPMRCRERPPRLAVCR